MARILGGIATSHSPTIGFALDHEKQHEPAWAPVFAAYEPIQRWLSEKQPDVLFVIYNDHATSFFFDHYSTFALGVGESYAVADEGGGARALPALKGHAALAQHLGTALVAEEFDLSFFQDRALDHGCFSPLSLLWPHQPDWPGRVVPLQVGVVQFPMPTARRCYHLGRALRRAIESYEEDLKVVIVATGGLSHQVHGERAGFNNTEWDALFLELIEKDPVRLTELTHADYARLGGLESAEVIMWLVMRGALSAQVGKVHQSYYLPTMTGLATAIYEDQSVATQIDSGKIYRQQIRRQTAGIEELTGTYLFTLERSVRAYRLNKFLHELIHPAFRRRFLQEPESLFREYQLTVDESAMIERRDWRELIQYGASFFLLEKLGAVSGVSNLHIYAAMRGETLEDFLKTRNAPGALYSVAARPKPE
ncbi:MAG TPA: gallate dioxygenase [Blastocatellia bacterium]|nr:gallate dioxygenase [Blastocatellia bacterium]